MSFDPRKQSNGVGVEDFELLSVIGRGGYGKVFMVRYTHSSEIFAMKVRCPLAVLAECIGRSASFPLRFYFLLLILLFAYPLVCRSSERPTLLRASKWRTRTRSAQLWRKCATPS